MFRSRIYIIEPGRFLSGLLLSNTNDVASWREEFDMTDRMGNHLVTYDWSMAAMETMDHAIIPHVSRSFSLRWKNKQTNKQ